ncbi:Glucose--fructose oxidoreductase precursor [Aquisphaera giovannonii]|uniref:Glucose--fructose oxidoreductase n=1 Tax=Aquisphaera giovannonii TaxID=406548 RepID=A0A5B9VWK1_9BACT|nr:Gfo/Idh/MocA family oxidoreductase [Aquisphaera giovannonii]QEH32155.1 Glucose--fructose oxidoreductase precursor [Aquisphaera giovannonii]
MIRVGIVGLGYMGRMHYRCWNGLLGAKVTAVCEANPKVLAAAGEPTKGNVGGAADHIDLDSLKVFSDLDALLAAREVDALSITLPTFLHADTTIKALEAGVHVLCEKPMALSVADCDRMVAAADRSGKTLQIGHCIRFWPEYEAARELIRGGTFGRPIAASFRRYSAMPSWSPDSWFADEQRSGGQPLDLHIHDTDYVHHLFGMPASVSSVADVPQSYIATQYRYPGGPAVVAESTWRMAGSFAFEMSFVIVLEGATILYDNNASPAFRVLASDGTSPDLRIPVSDGYAREVEHFSRIISGEPLQPVITPTDARETIRLVLAEKQSAREGRPVTL